MKLVKKVCKVTDIRVIDTIIDCPIDCSRIKLRTFKKGEIITSYIENRKQLCILKEGKAELIRTDFNGDETVLEYFTSGNLFGELFYSITSNTQLNVMAKEDVKVLFIQEEFFSHNCNKLCKYHDFIMKEMINLISEKMIQLTNHIEILTKKSIREKLLTYFSSLSYLKSSKIIHLPLSLTALASYLSIDRSAMMREMKYLEEEGFIKREKNKITLYENL